MASNLQELRKAAGYRNANDFAEAHEIPSSTYARYESNPDKIPMERAWQLADILCTTIDAIVGRESPAPGTARGEVQLEYDGLTPEARALADELREFVLMKDAKIRERKRREEERPWDALCYQYERQMLAEMGEGAAFGELVAFESAEEARSAFESFLQKQAAKKRGKFPIKAQELIDNQTIDKAQELIDNQTIDKIMEAYDRTHGEFDHEGTRVLWSTVDARVAVEFDSGMGQRGGGAKA